MSDSSPENPVRDVLHDVAIGGVAGSMASGMGTTLTPAAVSQVLTEWYNTSIKYNVILDSKKHILYREPKEKLVRTGMFELMQQAYKFMQHHSKGNVFVLYAPSYTGKTHNAACLLDLIAAEKPLKRGLYFTGGKQPYLPYHQAIAAAIGVPESCRKDFEWIKTLCTTLSGDAPETVSSSTINEGGKFIKWITDTFGAILNFFGLSQDADANPVADEIPDNVSGVYQPILILDDFLSKTEEELNFVYELCQWADRCRVFVLILTDKMDVAHAICQKNSLERIKPLPNSYDLPDGQKKLKLGDDIHWKSFAWTRKELTQYVSMQFDVSSIPQDEYDENGCLLMTTEGMSPKEAADTVCSYLASSLPQNATGFSA